MSEKDLINGFATAEGTMRFAESAVEQSKVPATHFHRSVNGLSLTSMGLGSYLGDQDEETNTLLEQAVYSGIESSAINVFDTAINYRAQLSERAIGKALHVLMEEGSVERDEVFVATKNGYLTPDGDDPRDFITYFREEYISAGVMRAEDIIGGIHCMDPAFLENQMHRSRDNLGFATLDLLYLHNSAESQIHEIGKENYLANLADVFAFYEDARKAGYIRAYGLATWDCFLLSPEKAPHFLNLQEIVQLAEKVGGENHGFKAIQLPFNLGLLEGINKDNQLIDGQPTSTIFGAKRLGLDVFTSVPLMQGQLLDFDLPDLPEMQTKAQTCIQFVRSTPGVTCPLVGQKQPEHIGENLCVAQVPPLAWDLYQSIFTVPSPIN